MSISQPFTVISFEDLKRRNDTSNSPDYYEPTWDQAKGVVRLAIAWGDRLGATRGDLVKITHQGRTATFTLKMSSLLSAEEIALDYDQKRQLGLLNAEAPTHLKMRRARFGTFSFLWKHVDPAIRLPFQISIWMALLGLIAGAILGVSIEHLWH